MASNFKTSDLAVNAAADALLALLNNGKLRLYAGVQPTTPDGALGAQVLLAELRFGSPAFSRAVAGVAVANPLTEEDDAMATGTATWFRALTADDVAIFDGSVGVAQADLILNAVSIQQHAIVAVTSLAITLPKA